MTDHNTKTDRLIPQIPPKGQRLPLIIDSDVANEIDDLYAIALTLAAPERFDLKGICCAHYNNGGPGSGPESVAASMALARELLQTAGMAECFPLLRGSQPMAYHGHPSPSPGVDFILDAARAAAPENPLWIVVLGAATTTASALLADPSIYANVRVVFHSRSETTWPERSVQFNVQGDIHAARALLESAAPLVWFDTGTHLTIPYERTREELSPLNPLGRFLHEFRDRNPWFAQADKGFYDLGDILFLLEPALCRFMVTDAPKMDPYMFFDFREGRGEMLRVYDIDVEAGWQLFFKRIQNWRAQW